MVRDFWMGPGPEDEARCPGRVAAALLKGLHPMIRAKFSVFSVVPGKYWLYKDGKNVEMPAEHVRLTAVCGGPNNPNESWNLSTPSGSLEMTICNPLAMGKLEVGKSYFLDFTPAPD